MIKVREFHRIERYGIARVIATGIVKMDAADGGPLVRAKDVLLEQDPEGPLFAGDPVPQVQFFSSDPKAQLMIVSDLELHREPTGLSLKITGITIDAKPAVGFDYYAIYTVIGSLKTGSSKTMK